MYNIRNRFLYFYIPATAEVRLKKEPDSAYCFMPAKTVRRTKGGFNYLVVEGNHSVTKALWDRRIHNFAVATE